MRRAARTVSVLVLCAVIIVAFYMYLNKAAGKRTEYKQEQAVTEMDRLLDVDFSKNYPPTPREVIKWYNRYSTLCFGDKKPTKKQTEKIAVKMHELLDDELANANPESEYAASLWSQVQDFTQRKAKIYESDVCNTDDIIYKTIDKRDYAYVQATYYIREASSFTTTYQKFVLRQDENDNWKIVGFSRTDKNGTPVTTTTKTK
ncbi:MAG: hypothetical protein PUC40_01485 [Lachnospiraceae bacterium]|nr:hypothetical protein [Lachnospiraceae bacterium]MDD5955642.1 hypothetical protein [Lachnospiraceae bacterium]